MVARVWVLTGLVAIGCSAPTPPPSIKTGVRVTPKSSTIQQGQSQSYTAAVTDSSGDSIGVATVTWTSSATNVATISGTGVAIGRNAGKTTIVATTPAGARDTAVLAVTDTAASSGPCNGVAANRTMKGFVDFEYAYSTTISQVNTQYSLADTGSIAFQVPRAGPATDSLVAWAGPAGGTGSENDESIDNNPTPPAIGTSVGSGQLAQNGPAGTWVTVLVDLTKCEYTIQAFYYLNITVSPNGPSGVFPIAWLQTPSAGLNTIAQMIPITAMGAGVNPTGDFFVPYGLSGPVFEYQSTAGEANVTFVTHAVP
jgi:Bacterial Ig-like domain (group 2)